MARGPKSVPSFTTKKQSVFLAELADGQSISAACRKADTTKPTAYRLRQHSSKFAAAWDDAIETGTDVLEDVAVDRARNGSDTMLIFMLKSRRPDKYRERSVTENYNRTIPQTGAELADAFNALTTTEQDEFVKATSGDPSTA